MGSGQPTQKEFLLIFGHRFIMTEEFYCALLVCTCLAFILDGQKKDQINVCFEPDVAGGQPDWWGRRKNILVCWIVLQLVVKKKVGTNCSPFRAGVIVQLKECLVTEGKFDRKHFPRIPQYIFLRVVQCVWFFWKSDY